MTDITDEDRYLAREWATAIEDRLTGAPPIRAAARVILATVDATPKTLADELRAVPNEYGMPPTFTARVEALADRVGDIEAENVGLRIERDQADYLMQIADRERDEAREALAVEGRRVEKIAKERDEAKKERAESNAETPDPAAPYMRATIAALRWEYGVELHYTFDGKRRVGWWGEESSARSSLAHPENRTRNPRLVRRLVGPVEVVE